MTAAALLPRSPGGGGGTRALAFMGIVSVQAVFAGYQLLGKAVLSGGMNPIGFALLRELSASAVFVVAALLFAPASGWPKRGSLGRFALCGLAMFGNVFLNLLALTWTTASMVALLQPTQPVFASALAYFLGQEQMTVRKILGVLVCVSGGFALVASQRDVDGAVNGGCVLVLLQCASGASYVVSQRPLVRAGYSPLIVSGCSYVFASGLTVVVGLAYFLWRCASENAEPVQWWDASPFFALVLLYCVLLTTVYNYVVIAWVTGQLGATLVTLFTLLQGAFACLAERVLFSAPLHWIQGLGSLLILSGLFLVIGVAPQSALTTPGSSGEGDESCSPARGRASSAASYVDTRGEWAEALVGGTGSKRAGSASAARGLLSPPKAPTAAASTNAPATAVAGSGASAAETSPVRRPRGGTV